MLEQPKIPRRKTFVLVLVQYNSTVTLGNMSAETNSLSRGALFCDFSHTSVNIDECITFRIFVSRHLLALLRLNCDMPDVNRMSEDNNCLTTSHWKLDRMLRNKLELGQK